MTILEVVEKLTPDWKGPGWYRFQSPAGTKIPTTPIKPFHCGMAAPGWLKGSHPSTPGQTINAEVCFYWGSNQCWGRKQIKIRHCGQYFLYELQEAADYESGYCAI